MGADLPTGGVRFAGHFEKLLLVVNQDPEIAGPADVGLRDAGIALRNRSIAKHLHSAHADPLVSQSGMDAGRKHLFYIRLADEAVNSHAQIAGRIRALISDKIFGLPGWVINRSDSAAHDHLGDELDACLPV